MIWIDLIGFVGLLGIAVAWSYETIRVIRFKLVEVPLKFTILYIIASSLLVVYSVFIDNIIFILLNGLATLSAVVNFIVDLRYAK